MNSDYLLQVAKARIADDHRWAAEERLAHQARAAKRDRQAPAGHEPREGVLFSLRRLITHPSWT